MRLELGRTMYLDEWPIHAQDPFVPAAETDGPTINMFNLSPTVQVGLQSAAITRTISLQTIPIGKLYAEGMAIDAEMEPNGIKASSYHYNFFYNLYLEPGAGSGVIPVVCRGPTNNFQHSGPTTRYMPLCESTVLNPRPGPGASLTGTGSGTIAINNTGLYDDNPLFFGFIYSPSSQAPITIEGTWTMHVRRNIWSPNVHDPDRS